MDKRWKMNESQWQQIQPKMVVQKNKETPTKKGGRACFEFKLIQITSDGV